MRKLASIPIVNAVESIPNADAIEKVRVLGWWVVAKKCEHTHAIWSDCSNTTRSR